MINRYDIPNLFSDYCNGKGWVFCYGTDEYMSAMSAGSAFEPDQLIFAMDWAVTPTLAQGGAVDSVTHNCTIMLGRKFETGTMASLDETMKQKHDRRLAELCELLINMVDDITCYSELQPSLGQGRPLPNMWNNNIDFFMFPLTLAD